MLIEFVASLWQVSNRTFDIDISAIAQISELPTKPLVHSEFSEASPLPSDFLLRNFP